MPRVIFVEQSGARYEVIAENGDNAMRVANNHDVPGIHADCGGVMTCATCHVHVADDWLDRVGTAPEEEREMLEMAVDPGSNSRLSCQIIIEERLDGVILNIPKSQF
jgi:ferredoxin, 2Fe-2S